MFINGENHELLSEQDLQSFLMDKGYEIAKIAVEYNGTAISRVNFPKIMLKNSDHLEIVCFVGGG